MNDERLFATVADELRQQGPIAGLWAKAYAECDGVESKAKALYLRYRVAQLAEAERLAAACEVAEREMREKAVGNTSSSRISYVLAGAILFYVVLAIASFITH